jgi:hypothetical protein
MPRLLAAISASRNGASLAGLALSALACGGNASAPASSEPATMAPNGGAGGSTADQSPGRAGVSTGPALPPPGPPGGVPNELLEVGAADPEPVPLEGACPAGSRPIVPEDCAIPQSETQDAGTSDGDQLDKRGFRPPACTCEYVCSPGCSTGEVCAPEAPDSAGPTCSCHPALDPAVEGCVWTRFVDDGTFAGSSSEAEPSWRLWTSGAEGASRAIVEAGRLELAVTSRCAYAWAGAVARVPARSAVSGGMALVFDYAASGGPLDSNTLLGISLYGLVDDRAIPFTAGGSERRCVQLNESPALALLQFEVSAYGACGESIDYRLTVEDVRLEPDPQCP